MKKILYIVSRLPTSYAGREYMINQNIRFLLESGNNIEIAHFDKNTKKNTSSVSYREMPRPHILEVIFNGIFKWRLSFQERLFFSSRAKSMIAELIKENSYDLILVDMVRMAYLVEDEKVKKVLEYDDLLSLRYRRMVNDFSDNIDLLGTYSEKYPPYVATIVKPFRKKLLSLESYLINKRERLLSEKFDKLSFTSPLEASSFRGETGLDNIFFNPPSVPVNNLVEKKLDEDNYYVFVGNLKANHNLACLKEISKVFASQEIKSKNIKICIYGDYDQRAIDICSDNDLIILKGMIADISSALCNAACLIAPIPFGSGIKVKVVEAMSYGVAVITNSIGVEGIGVTAGIEYVECNAIEEFVSKVIALKDSPEELKIIGAKGRAYVINNFSEEKVRNNLLTNIETL